MAGPGLEQLADSLGYSVLCCRRDGPLSIAYAGESFYRTLGFENGAVSALLDEKTGPVLQNDPPVDWNRISAEIRERGFASPELKLVKRDGRRLWASYRVGLRKGADGEEYFCGLLEDITLRRRSQERMREQAEEFEALTANAPCGVLRCRADKSLTIELVSEGFCRMTDYPRDEIAGRFGNRFLPMVCEKDRDLLLRRAEGDAERDSVLELTYRIVGRNGRLIWVLDKSRRRKDCNGNVWLYSVLMDVTETKKAQDELTATEERYRMILKYAADPVLDCDLKTGRFYYSPAFLEKFGAGVKVFRTGATCCGRWRRFR